MDGIASVGPFSRTARRIGPIVAFLCLALIVDGSARARRVVAGAGDPVTAGIAAYFPDTAPNRAALTSRPGLGVVVMNTLQAAGSQTAVAEYKGAGKRVFGYMAAGYAPSGANGIAAKSLAQLQATAGTILAAYPTIDGLFLDEVLNNDAAGCAAPSAFYVSFYQWFKSAYAAKSLILNPGTALCASFAGSADMYLVFENRLGFYRSAFVPYFAQTDFDWMRALPNSQVWSIVYGVPLADMPALINELADYAGVVTVLSDNADHPYSNLPPEAELNVMNARATGTSVVVTTTTTTVALGASTTTTTAPPVAGAGGATGGSTGAVPVVPPGETIAVATTTSATSTTSITSTAVPTTTGPASTVLSPSTLVPPTTKLPAMSTTPTTAPAGSAGPALAPTPVVVARSARVVSPGRSVARYTTKLIKRTRCRTVFSARTARRYRSCRKVTLRVRVLLPVKRSS